MASPSGNRDIRALAKRVHQRWLEYRRRYPGRSVPISDTLSRILEHDPDYKPQRRRQRNKPRRPLQNPGVFTLKEIADALDTTVGDLLGEPEYTAVRDAISDFERLQLHSAVTLLRKLFDLDDERLLTTALADPRPSKFPVPARDFIVYEHDFPRPMPVWMIPTTDASDIRLAREVHEPHLHVIRVIGDSMAPELQDGWKVVVDTQRTTPAENALVAVYLVDRGGVIGRWRAGTTGATLHKTNPVAQPLVLPAGGEWFVWGTITTIVSSA